MEKISKEQQLEGIKGILSNEDFGRMWMKMHTPWVRRSRKIGRNELCPCGSGKKYKYCECYKKKDVNKYTLDEKHTKGWR
jgi:uncharacterized protein YecA (UPF0149 family)